MRTVHKYPIEIADTHVVSMPEGAKVLHVAMQDGYPYIWAEVDTEQSLQSHYVYVRGTGNPFTGYETQYIGTFQDGPYIWHVYL